MKPGLTLLLVCFLPLAPLTVHAQGPDRRPRPSLPEEEIEGTPAYAALSCIEVADSLLEPNVLIFCGEQVNLDPSDRKRKLRRELASLSRFPSRSNRRRLISFLL